MRSRCSTYERFRTALGRLPEFAPAVIRKSEGGRIEIRPHWVHEDNAYYEPDEARCVRIREIEH